MANRLSNKIAVVTGSGKGIGRAIAERFASEGARVVVCDIDAAAAISVAEGITASGGVAAGLQVDVSDKRSVEALVAASLQKFGRVDIVCNNAGVLDDFTPLGDVSDELWQRVIGINLTGAFMISRAFLPGMLGQGGGTFVNLASMAGLVAQAGGLAYTVSKHGVIGLTKQVSADYGPAGIRANAICPGAIETDLSRSFLQNSPEVLAVVESVPAGRQGRPAEIADLALYLASDESSFVHGASMVIDGGWTIR
ncbi:3-oxoacyl-(Acyl-carrier-protein) reductase precursor [Novosphingobium resinovorum]|uniref:3-oxoacyl-(Acyl-carrier-protein) reductase n=1 Tax=Novosphingobium resinovorum TaxID=158500 RepID=A0A031JR32_9SPHN|nr:glucose 1-dehydrogenase [Novosphingobium resinovorum]EZP79339.1 3-oxoacyl-(Acyl-carrier-protein) reductase precursor [Novosphingobium resinovorum]